MRAWRGKVRVKYAAPLVRSTTVITLFVCLAARGARAHQAPDLDANNRYLKVTLLPDRVRLVETFLFGERPGAAERQRMDTSGDGVLDDKERAAYGARAAAELAATVSLAGAPAAAWRVLDVGVGEPPRATGGSFAVDLGLDLLYADPRAAAQVLVVDDRAALPHAGESELRIDESPGVRVSECHLQSEREGIELVYTWQGNARAPGERAVTVRFSVDESLRPPARRWGWWIVGSFAGAVAGAAAVAAALRRQWKVKG